MSRAWPFVESPGEFTARLMDAMNNLPPLGAVRHVLIENPPTLAALEARPGCVVDEAMATLPVEIHGRHFEVPARVQLHIVNLTEQLSRNVAGQRFIGDLLAFTEHCISAAEEGEDYCVPRSMLDAMTTLGLMEKVGRGKWAPTPAAEQFVAAAPKASAPPADPALPGAVDWRALYRHQTAMRYMDNSAAMRLERAENMADEDIRRIEADALLTGQTKPEDDEPLTMSMFSTRADFDAAQVARNQRNKP